MEIGLLLSWQGLVEGGIGTRARQNLAQPWRILQRAVANFSSPLPSPGNSFSSLGAVRVESKNS
jgi:hypothetical protein